MAATNEMIRIEGLYKVYGTGENQVVALKNVNLSVKRGDIHGIIGMSGAGKSTLIRCMNLLDRPTEGRIFIDGVEMTGLSDKMLLGMRRNVGMIFQQFNLLMQRNVEKNVRFPMEISGVPREKAIARALELLDIVSLSDKRYAYPAQLSGGQKQRVAIARALTMEPKVLLCDEATSALDPMTTAAILSLLKDINKRLGITIIVITHEMEVIKQICSQVSIIDGGEIAESGAVSEVFSHPASEAGKRLFHGVSAVRNGLPEGKVVRVIFNGGSTYEPVISNIVLSCGAPVSILSAQIETVAGESRGQMLLQLPKDDAVAQNMLSMLRQKDVVIEEVSQK
ncbi:MAG: methionine ABC transporter ATP-binding protein [Christensenellales bacterium]|jgi:D-methionine transport system ATP-binding protein